MSAADSIRSSLEQLLAQTHNTVRAGTYWVGDAAAERQVHDNLRSGALAFRTAHAHARRGLEALGRGDLELAETFLREGKNLRTLALERQVAAHGLETLRSGAKARGRRRMTDDRDVALAKAVVKQETRGLSGLAARNAAISGDADLKAAFGDMSDAGVRKALRNGRLRLTSEKIL